MKDRAALRRLFMAVPVVPDAPLLDLLADGRSHFRGDKIRWVVPEQMHITLKFLGETPAHRIEGLCRVFEEVASGHAPFSCRLEGAGLFGSRYAPRVIWVGTSDDAPLRAVGEAILESAAVSGFPRERLPFVPHLTLGRITHLRDKQRLTEWITQQRGKPFGELPVTEVVLYESILRTTGAEHLVVKRFPLSNISNQHPSDHVSTSIR